MRLESRVAKLERTTPPADPFACMPPEVMVRVAQAFLLACDNDEGTDPAMVEAAKNILIEYGMDGSSTHACQSQVHVSVPKAGRVRINTNYFIGLRT